MKRALLFVLGAYVGVTGAVVHRHTWSAVDVRWPWGLLLAVAVTYVVTLAADRVVPVVGGAWFGLGWGAMLLAQQAAPGDSYLVGSDGLGWSWTIGCLLAIVLAAVGPRRRRPSTPS